MAGNNKAPMMRRWTKEQVFSLSPGEIKIEEVSSLAQVLTKYLSEHWPLCLVLSRFDDISTMKLEHLHFQRVDFDVLKQVVMFYESLDDLKNDLFELFRNAEPLFIFNYYSDQAGVWNELRIAFSELDANSTGKLEVDRLVNEFAPLIHNDCGIISIIEPVPTD